MRRRSSRPAVAMVDARYSRGQPTGYLVVDRSDPARNLLGEDALLPAHPDQHRLAPGQRIRIRILAEIDGEVVHAHGAHDRTAFARDEYLGVVRQRPAPAVAVADREHSEHRVALGHEAPSITGALSRRAALRLGYVGGQLERRIEPLRERVDPKRVHPIHRDATAHHVEMGALLAQGCGAVGSVHDNLWMSCLDLSGPLRERVQLALEKRIVLVVGGREVRHNTGQLDTHGGHRRLHHTRGLLGIARTEAPHAAVELDVHAPATGLGDRAHRLLAPHDNIRAGLQRFVQLDRAERTHHEQPLLHEAAPPQFDRLACARHRQPAGTGVERRTGARGGTVAVAVGLDHHAQLTLLRQLSAQARAIALDCRQIHTRERATSAPARLAAGSAAIPSPAITPSAAPSRSAASRPARTCKYTPAAAASKASRFCDSSAAIVPLNTSPVPAVASAGLSPGLIATRPAGSTTSVSSPFSTTTAPDCSAAARALDRRSRCTESLSLPSKRASSPTCGVSTVGACLRARSDRWPAWAFSPSASSTIATGATPASSRAKQALVCSRPSPGPSTSAPARWSASSIAESPSGTSAPRSSGSPRVIVSISCTSSIPRSDSGTHAVTYPAPARIAASEAIAGAPVSPREPPTTTTWPLVNLVELAPRRGNTPSTRSPIKPMSACDGAPRGTPISIVHVSPTQPLPGCIQRPGLPAWKLTG